MRVCVFHFKMIINSFYERLVSTFKSNFFFLNLQVITEFIDIAHALFNYKNTFHLVRAHAFIFLHKNVNYCLQLFFFLIFIAKCLQSEKKKILKCCNILE